MTLKIKDKKIFDETVYQTIIYNEKIIITGVNQLIEDPDPSTQKDRIQPDPDPQHCVEQTDRGKEKQRDIKQRNKDTAYLHSLPYSLFYTNNINLPINA